MGALLRGFGPAGFDRDAAAFLLLAIVALVIDQVAKFKGFGLEFELRRRVSELQNDVEQVENAVAGLEKDIGPGGRTSPPPPEPPNGVKLAAATPLDPDDPNKGRFGGSAEAGGRRLTANIKPLSGEKSARCRVRFQVVSTDPDHPLSGSVRFYLHPTFGDWTEYDVNVKGGIAADEIISYGAFTIGAQADTGQTQLELDLMDVPGGTPRFYDN